MNRVDPIKDKKDIEKIKKYLHTKSLRNYLLFVIGINTAIKSSYILQLRLSDIVEPNLNIKESIILDSGTYKINYPIRIAIEEFIENKTINMDDFLFVSQKTSLPINRSQLYKILKDATINCEIEMCIGNETLRKTYGYHYYQQTNDIRYLKSIFHKNSEKQIVQYLDLEKENVNEEFCL